MKAGTSAPRPPPHLGPTSSRHPGLCVGPGGPGGTRRGPMQPHPQEALWSWGGGRTGARFQAWVGPGCPVLWRLGRAPAQLRREGGLLHGRSHPSRLHGFCPLNHAAAPWGPLGLAHRLDHAHTHTCPRQSLLRLLRPQRRERGRVPGAFLCPWRPVLPGSEERQGSCSVSMRSDSSPSSAPGNWHPILHLQEG